jgi:hypothetical protein
MKSVGLLFTQDLFLVDICWCFSASCLDLKDTIFQHSRSRGDKVVSFACGVFYISFGFLLVSVGVFAVGKI